MARGSSERWQSVEERSASVYVLAGAILMIYAALLGYQAFVDPATNFHDNEAGIVGPVGFAVGFVGLLGLYPSLSAESPTLARAGAVVAVLAALGWTVIALTGLASQLGVDAPTAVEALGFLGLVGMLVGYPSFGAGVLRTGTGSRSLGLLLFVPPLLFVLLVVGNVITGGTAIGAALISSAYCVTHLGLGHVLRTEGQATDQRG